MGFSVVQGSPQTIWAKVSGTDTLYVGSIVEVAVGTSGLVPIGAGAGAADSTGKAVPYGVVIGNNDKSKTYNSTYKGNSITGVNTQAAQLARDFALVEGVTKKGDPAAYVEIQLITPETILRGPIYNAAYGTAPTVQTISVIQTDGMVTAETWSAADAAAFTTLESTIYMREGLNRGLYRNGINTTTTAPQVTLAFPYDNTTSDTGLQVPIKEFGPAKVNFDTESTYIDANAIDYSSAYYVIDVVNLDLSVAGREFCEFKFNGDHFARARA